MPRYITSDTAHWMMLGGLPGGVAPLGGAAPGAAQGLMLGSMGTAAKMLKLDTDTLAKVVGGLGEAISLTSALVGVGGAVLGAFEFFEKVNGNDKTSQIYREVKAIAENTESLLKHADNETREERRKKLIAWGNICGDVESKLKNVQIAREVKELDLLRDRLDDLRDALFEMLGRPSRAAGEPPIQGAAVMPYMRPPFTDVWWTSACRSPLMERRDGARVDFAASPPVGLWDAGWFLPVLGRALMLFPVALRTLEAGFLSTGWERATLLDLADSLEAFARAWDASIICSNPTARINPGGLMRADAAAGILLGAADPSTGVAVIDWWTSDVVKIENVRATGLDHSPSVFDIALGPFGSGFMATGRHDYRCLNPAESIQAATIVQSRMESRLIFGGGLVPLRDGSMAEWQGCGLMQMRGIARASSAALMSFDKSQFVDLKPATALLSPIAPTQGEGGIRPAVTGLDGFWAPRKDYRGTRIHEPARKTFHFGAARRQDRSGLQLGYRLRIGDWVRDLIPFSRPGGAGVIFPTEAIEWQIRGQGTVHDCCQTGPFSAAMEDAFEREERPSGGRRAFINPRPGEVAIDVRIAFEYDPQGLNQHGVIRVHLNVPSPETTSHALVLPVEVLETRIVYDDPMDKMKWREAEVVADSMTLHLVPSFIRLEADFFDDLDAARLAKLLYIPQLQDKFSLEGLVEAGIPREPVPDPREQRWGALGVERQLAWADRQLDALKAAFPVAAEAELARFVIPKIQR